jgi:hypothetical protein
MNMYVSITVSHSSRGSAVRTIIDDLADDARFETPFAFDLGTSGD